MQLYGQLPSQAAIRRLQIPLGSSYLLKMLCLLLSPVLSSLNKIGNREAYGSGDEKLGGTRPLRSQW